MYSSYTVPLTITVGTAQDEMSRQTHNKKTSFFIKPHFALKIRIARDNTKRVDLKSFVLNSLCEDVDVFPLNGNLRNSLGIDSPLFLNLSF